MLPLAVGRARDERTGQVMLEVVLSCLLVFPPQAGS